MKRTGTRASGGVLIVVMVLVLLIGGCELRFQNPFDHPADDADTDIFDYDSDGDNNGSNVTPVPFRTVAIGTPGAWDGLQPVVTDPVGDSASIHPGTDIVAVWLAQDNQFLYWRMDLADGAPNYSDSAYDVAFWVPGRPGDVLIAGEFATRIFLSSDAGHTLNMDKVGSDDWWESQQFFSSDWAAVSTYLEAKIPLHYVEHNPSTLMGYSIGPEWEQSDNTSPRDVQFDLSNISYGPFDYSIGDIGPAGGWIFYVDVYNDHPWTYLEAAPADIVDGAIETFVWSDITNEEVGTSQEIGTGLINTMAIIGQAAHTESAAQRCVDYEVNGFSDWFLPSMDEQNAIWTNLVDDGAGGNSGIGNFSLLYYWSSSENDSDSAWGASFFDGHIPHHPKGFDFRVRAIRAF